MVFILKKRKSKKIKIKIKMKTYTYKTHIYVYDTLSSFNFPGDKYNGKYYHV